MKAEVGSSGPLRRNSRHSMEKGRDSGRDRMNMIIH